MNDQAIQNPSIIEIVCSNPCQYTMNGTLEEVSCFLGGYYSGMSHKKKELRDPHITYLWFDFCYWAFDRVKKNEEKQSWQDFILLLREQHKNNQDAISELIMLYKLFSQEYPKNKKF